MQAMVYRGPYKIRVEEKGIPAIEHPNDAIVRVTKAAICGSDLHLYHGLMPDTRIGHTFGHEFIGVVHQVGSSVQNLKVGDRVMVLKRGENVGDRYIRNTDEHEILEIIVSGTRETALTADAAMQRAA